MPHLQRARSSPCRIRPRNHHRAPTCSRHCGWLLARPHHSAMYHTIPRPSSRPRIPVTRRFSYHWMWSHANTGSPQRAPLHNQRLQSSDRGRCGNPTRARIQAQRRQWKTNALYPKPWRVSSTRRNALASFPRKKSNRGKVSSPTL